MLNSIICVLSIGYGIKQFLYLRKQTNNHDAIAMLLLSAVIVGYCIPIGHYTLPTVESLYTKLFKSVSDYMLGQLKVS
ncbi:hypothetical protein [Paenibacillus qinlingensis]|uniref:hypothetical protein n=1 Tax=Paenibacillus qinlingensis TaxID=1837343 RepID=UPI0015674505|nr:hypothetical protein [Paenibacillus qinlingensis]NQX59847.1 hypothetical protein [Paenibacillus qinlingensis]